MPPPSVLVLLGPKTPDGPWLSPYEMRPSLSKLDGWPNPKLYGDRFMNFGAFGRDSFKEWDWMWGRLDGAITLAKALLPDSLSDEETSALITPLVVEILSACEMDLCAVYDRCVEVLSMKPSALIASSRDSEETDLELLIDRAARMLTEHQIVASRTLRQRLATRGAVWWLSRKAKRAARKL